MQAVASPWAVDDATLRLVNNVLSMKPQALSATADGRALMQAAFFAAGVAAAQAHFQDGFFSADATMRAKFADGFLTPAKLNTAAQTWTFNGADATGQVNILASGGDARVYFGPTGAKSTYIQGYSSAPNGAGNLKFVQDAIERMHISGNGRVAIRSDGTAAADPPTDAALDIQGLSAFLLPRLTTAQRDALTGTNGMLVFNTSTGQLNLYNNGWVAVT